MVVVTAIDGKEGSNRVLSEGWKLADQFEEPLHIVFVYEGADHQYLIKKSVDFDDTISREQAEDLADRVVGEAADDATDEYEAIGRTGSPSEEILKYASDVDASYVVVGGRSRSPVGKALFGSVTQSVLLNADCPVLAVMDER